MDLTTTVLIDKHMSLNFFEETHILQVWEQLPQQCYVKCE